MTTEKIMFELIRSVVFESEISDDKLSKIKENLSEETLESLYKLSKAHDVANLVGAALSDNRLIEIESEIQKKLYKEKFLAAFRCERLVRELAIITDTLEEAGIDHIPLKGSVIRDIYPQAWMRTSCDIDVLVKREDLEAAVECLRSKLGYSVEDLKTGHDISLYSSSKTHVELHYRLDEKIKSANEVLLSVWEHSTLQDGKKHAYKLTNEFLLFHVIAHAAKHIFCGGCGARCFIDLMLIKQKLNINTDRFNDLIDRSGLTAFTSACYELCGSWFDESYTNDKSNVYLYDFEKYVLSGGVYGIVSNHIKVSRKNTTKSYAISRIFVPYDTLKNRYPILIKYKILFPLFQVVRWFSSLGKKDVERIKREIETNNAISDAEIDRSHEMLIWLGLEK